MWIVELIKIFWFFLPAGIANMSPVLFRGIHFLDFPIDFNRKLGGKPIFGKNKTYRGLFWGVVSAVLFVFLQVILYSRTSGISLIDYSLVNPFILGALLGSGALIGDLTKSFFKRRLNIEPGKSWVPFDQVDWIIGAAILVQFYIAISFFYSLIAIFLFGLLHPLINLLGYALKIKKNKF